jgi:hypothetical protein
LLTAREIMLRKGSAILFKAKTAPLIVTIEKRKIGLNN